MPASRQVDMRWFIAFGVYALALVLTAGVVFFLVILLAGPHAGLLPHFAELLVITAGWLTVLFVPLLAAVSAWRRCSSLRAAPHAEGPAADTE